MENLVLKSLATFLKIHIYRNHLITSLVNLVRDRGYEGVSIDFEFVPPERRNEFISF